MPFERHSNAVSTDEKLMRRVGLRLLHLTMFNGLMGWKLNVGDFLDEIRRDRLMKRTWARMTMARCTINAILTPF